MISRNFWGIVNQGVYIKYDVYIKYEGVYYEKIVFTFISCSLSIYRLS